MRIALIASEVMPFAKTGGLADVCGALPLALEKLGHEVVVVMPNYRGVATLGSPIAIRPFSERARVATIGKNVRVFFLIHKDYFDRPNLYGESSGDYPDNLDRFSFFCHEAVRFLKDRVEPVDIIHCHDWQTALIPVLLKEFYSHDPFFGRTRTVMTIHNLAYQGVFPKQEYSKLGVDRSLFHYQAIEFYDKINLLKAGIIFSDQVTTVSPQYAREIQTPEFGCGLEGVLRSRRDCLTGILNGLDYDQWDPAKDPLIAPNYNARDWLAKRLNKEKLQGAFKLPIATDIPVFGLVARLCYQKGLDLIESAFDELMQRPLYLVLLGIGEEKYQKMLVRLAKKYPQKCSALIRYDEDLAHLVYAGSDFFLMSSSYEPCGLAQMIALRYGTIPVVSYVGGLIDTIVDVSVSKTRGNGIVMPSYSVSGMLEAVDRAIGTLHQKQTMNALVAHGMACRWPWEASAKHYEDLYTECLRSA